MEVELLDWEVLHNLDSDSNSVLVNSPKLMSLEEIEGDTEGMIRSDYFSLDNQIIFAKTGNELGFAGFGETQNQYKGLGRFWSDFVGDGLVLIKFEDVEKESDIGFSDCMKKGAELENSSEFDDGTTSVVELEGREGNPTGNEGSTTDEMKLCVKSVFFRETRRG
ncbi:hypothetical protein CRYUN_Cryun26dG0129300 [Craigia yunnanensis]